MSRFFLMLAPDFYTKIDVLDADEPAERMILIGEYGAPEAFLDGAAVGDFVDLQRRERLLVRLGRKWPMS